MVHDIARKANCDVTMSNGIATTHTTDVTMHHDIARSLLYYLVNTLKYDTKTRTVEIMFIVFGRDISLFSVDL